MRKFIVLTVIFIVCLGLVSCDKPETVRAYEEKVILSGENPKAAKLPPMHPPITGEAVIPDAPAAETALLSWALPQGWTEEEGSGMRLATIKPFPADSGAVCTVVSLGAEAGDLGSNIVRWIGQLNIEAPDGKILNEFISRQNRFQTPDGYEGIAVDLSEFVAGHEAQSMIAGILNFSDRTVFVKLTGLRKELEGLKSDFLAFCATFKAE